MELKWKADRYACEAGDADYVIESFASGVSWELKHISERGVPTPINAIDDDGAFEWPSAAMAQLAAQQHYERMRTTGETPDVAASRIPTDPAWYEAKMGETP